MIRVSMSEILITSRHVVVGEPCDLYHCVLESKSFLEKMTVSEHTLPFFLPLREAENDLLSSNAMVRLVFSGCIFFPSHSVVSLFGNIID